jgi:hypothetical protein
VLEQDGLDELLDAALNVRRFGHSGLLLAT